MSGALVGRSAVITGASQGLGFAIARAYLAEGAHVLICAREEEALETAASALRREASGLKVIAEPADVSVQADAERVVRRAIGELGGVEILVNNAGVYGPLGRLEEVDWRDWTRAVEVNLYGSVLMCRALLPHFRANRYGKIVQLSGGGATHPLPRISAYAASKAAVVRFAETLAEEIREDHIDVNCIAPGPLNTRLLDEVLRAGAARVGEDFYHRAEKQKSEGGAPLDRGASLAVFLAAASSDGITGKLLSAVWDPWETLGQREKDLRGDVYTLRRIVPKDRGLSWGEK